jgi:hypothetical protein
LTWFADILDEQAIKQMAIYRTSSQEGKEQGKPLILALFQVIKFLG